MKNEWGYIRVQRGAFALAHYPCLCVSVCLCLWPLNRQLGLPPKEQKLTSSPVGAI